MPGGCIGMIAEIISWTLYLTCFVLALPVSFGFWLATDKTFLDSQMYVVGKLTDIITGEDVEE